MNEASTAASAFEGRLLGRLADLSQALAVSIDIETTLRQAVDRIADCMQADAASVFLLDASSENLVCRACAGPVDIVGLRLPLGTGIVGRAFAANATQMVRDARNDPRFADQIDSHTGFSTRSLLATPLATARGPIGVIEVLNKSDGGLFDATDRDLLRMLAAPTALAIGNAALASELLDHTRIRRELQLARRMQRSLLPKRRRAAYPVLGFNRPAREISGDFYDHFDLPDGRIAFAIGDVAGKGLDAALLMVRTASMLRWAGKDELAPGQWLEKINDELCATVSGGSFVCVVVGYYDPANRHVVWANAGFPPALLRDAAGNWHQWLAEGPPLAIQPGVHYPEQAAELGDGCLHFFSDGVTDVRDAQRCIIGIDGVRELFDRHRNAAAPARLRAIVSELRRLRFADDATLLFIEDRR